MHSGAKQKQPFSAVFRRCYTYLICVHNVVGLINHDHCRTFATILNTLDRLGYGVEWQCLNSKDFGVPQSRNRVYIIGYLDERCRGKYFLSPKQQEVLLFKPTVATKGSASTPPKD